MKSIISAPERINGEDIKVNHLTYKPDHGMVIIYLHACRIPETDIVYPYVGRTKHPLIQRMGDEDYKNYRYGTNSCSKMSDYLYHYGSKFISTRILCVVPEALQTQAEQDAIDKYGALEDGLNTYRAQDNTVIKKRRYINNSKANEKNMPEEITLEDYEIVCKHLNGTSSSVIINQGMYEHFFSNELLCLDKPSRDGHLVAHPSDANGKKTSKTALRYLEGDLGLNCVFGYAGCHALTLDNILVGTSKKTGISLRRFLQENPKYQAKVPYLAYGAE